MILAVAMWMGQLPPWVELVLGQRVLLLLTVGVLILMVFAIGLGVSVVLLRLRNPKTARRWTRLGGEAQTAGREGGGSARRRAPPHLPKTAARVHHEDPDRRARAVYTLGQLGLPQYAELV